MTGNTKERQSKAKVKAMSLVAGGGRPLPSLPPWRRQEQQTREAGTAGVPASRVWSQTGYRMAQTAGAGLGAVAVRPPKTSASAGTRRRCATPNTDMISITAAATKATMAPISMICPISQNA